VIFQACKENNEGNCDGKWQNASDLIRYVQATPEALDSVFWFNTNPSCSVCSEK
jgi:hypothetical protein